MNNENLSNNGTNNNQNPVSPAPNGPTTNNIGEVEIGSTQVQGTVDINPTVVQEAAKDVEIPTPQHQNVAPVTGNTEILDLGSISNTADITTKPQEEVQTTSNVAENNSINIVETSILQGAAGSAVIGSIEGEAASANNNPLPAKIDLSQPKENTTTTKTKKVKVMSKKDKIISALITVFVILVLGATGYSVYYFGYLTNPSMFSVKTINLELGESLPSTVSFYVNSAVKLDDMEFSVDTSQVAYDVIGTYTYTVKHKNVSKSGQIIIQDTKAPILTFKDAKKLTFMKGDKITKDKVVESCEDVSNCEYKMTNEIDTSVGGEKTVTIVATDEKNNQETYTATIMVYDIQRVVSCEGSPIPSEDNSYNSKTLLELNFDGNDHLVLTKKYKKFEYNNYGEYFELLGKYNNDDNYIFDSLSYSYKVPDTTDETINVTAFNDVLNYYKDNGYTCQ